MPQRRGVSGVRIATAAAGGDDLAERRDCCRSLARREAALTRSASSRAPGCPVVSSLRPAMGIEISPLPDQAGKAAVIETKPVILMPRSTVPSMLLQPPQDMPRRAGRPAPPAPWRATYRSRTGRPDRRGPGRAARRRLTGRSAPGPAIRRPAPMTGDPAATPGSPAAQQQTAPRRPHCPHLAPAHLTGPHRARGCASRDHRRRQDAH